MRKENEIIKTWDKYKLSQEEIEKNIQNGFLITGEDYATRKIKNSSKYLLDLNKASYLRKGIKIALIKNNIISGGNSIFCETFYLTDFFLVVCNSHANDAVFVRNNKTGLNYTEYSKDRLKFIPLDIVEEIKIEYTGNHKGTSQAITYKTKGDPVAGAIIGGAIAGTPGAIVGAHANSKEKTKYLAHASNYDYNSYNLYIKIKNCNCYIMKEFIESDNLKNIEKQKKEEFIKKVNEESKILIERAKRQLTPEEKREIINNTKKEFNEYVNKSKKKTIGYIVATIIMLLLLLIIIYFVSLI